MHDHLHDEEAIFHIARRLPPDQQAVYLKQVCGDDRELSERIEVLLKAHEDDGFLKMPSAEATATIDQTVAETPGMQIGRYRLLQQIGEGGFGVVFMAEQLKPMRQKVALKVIKPGMDTKEVIARFESERQALALMDHPNIARVFDGGSTEGGRPYFVMELVKGEPITDYCEKNDLTLPERLELFVSVCQAVQHAHQKGVIHRDIKPSNVLVTMYDGTPVVKVIDFGVAKALGQPLTERTLFTKFDQVVGTPLYMSPEQAGLSNLDIDTRADIYSLGVLLYELLTGATPFDRERLRKIAIEEVRRVIREEEPPKPSTKISSLGESATAVAQHRRTDPKRLSMLLSGDLDWIVMKALEKDRRRRYETAKDLAEDVHRHMELRPVEAGPPTIRYRMFRLFRRHRIKLVLASTTSALCLLTLILLFIFILEKARHHQLIARATEELRILEEEKRKTADGMTARSLLDAATADLQRDGGYRALIRLTSALEYAEKAADTELAAHIRHTLGAWSSVAPDLRQIGSSDPLLDRPQDLLVSPDTTLGACTDNEGSVWLFCPKTATVLRRLIQSSHLHPFRLRAISPDNKLIAVQYNDRLNVLDMAAGTPACEPLPLQLPTNAVQFSPNSRFLGIGHVSRVDLWDTSTWTCVASVDTRQGGSAVGMIVFSADSQLMLTRETFSSWGALWSISDGLKYLTGISYPGRIRCAEFSPDGKRLALGGDKGVMFLNTNTLAITGSLFSNDEEITDLRFSQDGTLLVAVDSQGAQLWDILSESKRGFRVPHSSRDPRLNDEGTILYTTGSPTRLSAWHVTRNLPLKTVELDLQSIQRVTFATLSERAVSTSTRGAVTVVETSSGKPIGRAIEHKVFPLATISADGKTIVTAHGSVVRAFDFGTVRGEQIGAEIEYPSLVSGLALNEDGTSLAVSCLDGTVRVSVIRGEVKSPHVIINHRPNHSHLLHFTPCGNKLFVTSRDQTAELWDLDSKTLDNRFRHSNNIQRISLSRDGTSVSTACREAFGVWDVRTGKLRGPFLRHGGNFQHVGLSSDGRFAATGGFDRAVRLWNVAQGRQVGPTLRHSLVVSWVGFGSDDATFCVLSSPRVITYRFEQPIAGDVASIRRLIETRTGAVFDAQGFVRQVSRGEWDDRRIAIAMSRKSKGIDPMERAHGEHMQQHGSAKFAANLRLQEAGKISKTLKEREERFATLLQAFSVYRERLGESHPETRATEDKLRVAVYYLDELFGTSMDDPSGMDSAVKLAVYFLNIVPRDMRNRWDSPRTTVSRGISQHEQIFERVIEQRPDDDQLWVERGRVLALRSRWSDAVEAYRKGVGFRGVENETFETAGVFLLGGEDAEYRSFCDGLLQEYGDTAEPMAAYHLARAVAAGPNGISPEQAIAWGQMAVAERQTAWHLHALALANFRAGNAAETIRLCEQSSGHNWSAQVLNRYLTALAFRDLGDDTKGHEVFQEAERIADDLLQRCSAGTFRFLPPDWIELHILRREANASFGNGAVSERDERQADNSESR